MSLHAQALRTPEQLYATPKYALPKSVHAQAMHLDPSNFSGLVAYRAGPRREPFSRQLHVEHLAQTGRASTLSGEAVPPRHNMFGSGLQVPDKWPGSWETDVLQHSRRGAIPAFSASTVLGSGAGGGAHPNLGHVGEHEQPRVSSHYGRLANGRTEEERRLLLLTNERARRHAGQRWAPTDTLGLPTTWLQQQLAAQEASLALQSGSPSHVKFAQWA